MYDLKEVLITLNNGTKKTGRTKTKYTIKQLIAIENNMKADIESKILYSVLAIKIGLKRSHVSKIKAFLIKAGAVERTTLRGKATSWVKETGFRFVEKESDLNFHIPPTLFSMKSLTCSA